MYAPIRRISILFASVCAAGAFAQSEPKAERAPFGVIFRSEVDQLIDTLVAARRDNGALGDGTARMTARILTAMGHCHRFYGLDDGPVVRRPVHFLFTSRRADGSYGAADDDPQQTTAWVLDALRVTDPKEHATEISVGTAWLEAQGVKDISPWRTMIVDLGAELHAADSDPKRAGAPIAASLREGLPQGADGQPDLAAAADALLRLVACQTLARELDGKAKGGDPKFSASAQRGFDFLLGQQTDGVFFVRTPQGNFPDTGLSAMGLAALQTKPRAQRSTSERELIEKGLDSLLAEQNADGSFGKNNTNYTTSAAVLALSMAEDPRFEKAMLGARNFILAIQNIEDRGYSRDDRDYGSIGYGGDQRGDLSNLGFAVDALRRTGLDAQHEAFAKALVFLQRTQNLRATNDFDGRRVRDEEGEWRIVETGDDGGSAYYPGNSPAGYVEHADGSVTPRSYGSMTYMMLRTYTLCGLAADDARIQRAIEWLERNWTLEENPGASPLLPEAAKYQGLYYYYMVLAQALATAGIETLDVVVDDGKTREVDWRKELRAALEARQQTDGSWLNDDNGRWWESQPSICTIYSLLALEHCARR